MNSNQQLAAPSKEQLSEIKEFLDSLYDTMDTAESILMGEQENYDGADAARIILNLTQTFEVILKGIIKFYQPSSECGDKEV